MAQNDPHATQPVLHTGTSLEDATMAMIMLHGRGASAQDILGLSQEFEQTNIAYLAPQAATNTWYPQRFIAPLEANEPWLSSALARIAGLIEHVVQAGIPHERIMLLGFSQGACLTLEYAARNARRYGGVVGLSGGLIGPDGMQRHDTGSLDGTPVFLGCSDVDFHIPLQRVHAAADTMKALGGNVETRIYPGMGHTINQDEVAFVQGMIKG